MHDLLRHHERVIVALQLALRAPLVTFLLLWNTGPAFSRYVEAAPLGRKWTDTEPPINLVHIEIGEINNRGEAVGYHHRPKGVDPPGARVLRIVQPPDAKGIYRARVALRDRATGTWVQKKAPSTFYPDTMSTGEVVEAILAAFHYAEAGNEGRFVGLTSRGFAIEGWFQNGRINAAYPLRGP
jgi:Bacterial EndoU nuclease